MDDIKLVFDEDGKAHILNEEYCIYCANAETVEKVKQAVDKQKPKKVNFDKKNQGKCPRCKESANILHGDKYCINCGQALDWRKEDEGK